MRSLSMRYDLVASTFTARVREVPPSAWENEAPCEGGVARDVVRHLVDWVPAFFDNLAGLDLGIGGAPSVDDDPAGAWSALDDGLRCALGNPACCGPVGTTARGSRCRPMPTSARS